MSGYIPQAMLRYLMFDQAGANFGRHHVDDGGEVVLEAVGEAVPAWHGLPVHLRDVLGHALHLNTPEHTQMTGSGLYLFNNLSKNLKHTHAHTHTHTHTDDRERTLPIQ